MENYNKFFKIMEITHKHHNARMCDNTISDDEIKSDKIEICALLGVDVPKLIELAEELEGIVVELQQGRAKSDKIARNHEINRIDRIASELYRMLDEIEQ